MTSEQQRIAIAEKLGWQFRAGKVVEYGATYPFNAIDETLDGAIRKMSEKLINQNL